MTLRLGDCIPGEANELNIGSNVISGEMKGAVRQAKRQGAAVGGGA